MSRLLDKLIAAEGLYGEAGVAKRLGIKSRMWSLIKARQYRLSVRVLRHALKNFPALRDDVLAYIQADENAAPTAA